MIGQPAAANQTEVDTGIRQVRQQGDTRGDIEGVHARWGDAGGTEAGALDMRCHQQERAKTGMVGGIAIDGHGSEGVVVYQFRQGDVVAGGFVGLESDAEFTICHLRRSLVRIGLAETDYNKGGAATCDWAVAGGKCLR